MVENNINADTICSIISIIDTNSHNISIYLSMRFPSKYVCTMYFIFHVL